jgi:hypothetical protein
MLKIIIRIISHNSPQSKGIPPALVGKKNHPVAGASLAITRYLEIPFTKNKCPQLAS